MKQKTSLIFFFIIIAILFIDIGNPNAIRQGTEGFYLLISQEMFEAGDLLTPRVYGDFHWSKPPFQFWLPMPFYYIFNGNFLLWGRVSILIFSLFSCFLISLWYERELKRNWFELFGLLLSPLYFIKYSRIFMMEMALAYLTTLSALYFYSFYKRKKRSSLIKGSIMGAFSILVKGPVSLVMLFPPITIFSLLQKRSFPIRALFFLMLTTLLGGVWFGLSYLRFGDDFFNYFFIRENLGKFNSKSYPITSVIQGLLIYSFPAIILLFPILKRFQFKVFKNEVNQYLGLCFLFFYFLWFLPKQKSHHYAVPAIPILLIFISYNFNEFQSSLREKYFFYLKAIGNFLFTIGFLILVIIFYFRASLALPNARFYFLGCFFCTALWTYLNKTKFKRVMYLRFIVPFIFLWQFLLPLGVLPTVPFEVKALIKKSDKVFVSYRKPFFIQETLNRDILMLPNDNLMDSTVSQNDLIFLGRSRLLKNLPPSFQILYKWKVWKRGVQVSHVVRAIQSGDIAELQESYAIVKKL